MQEKEKTGEKCRKVRQQKHKEEEKKEPPNSVAIVQALKETNHVYV